MSKSKMSSQSKTASALASIFLSLTCIFFGYAACAGIPFVAEKAAYAAIDDSSSPFDKEQLVDAALAIRNYSFGDHDAEALYNGICEINSAAATPYADATVEEMASAPESLTITEEQLAHLDDVHEVSSRLMLPALSFALLAAFLLMSGFKMFGTKMVIAALKWSGMLTLAIIGISALAACISFEAFFELFHSMLFSEGNWMFAADSLLITTLPESFWIEMGGIWAAVSALLAAASLATGILMSKKARKLEMEG